MELISIKETRKKLRESYEDLHAKAWGEYTGEAASKTMHAAAHVKAAIDELEGME